jgi:hypothetical protein
MMVTSNLTELVSQIKEHVVAVLKKAPFAAISVQTDQYCIR